MQFGYVLDPNITYNRRVLKGIAQFTKTRGDLSLQIVEATSPAPIAALDGAGLDGLILATFFERSPGANRLRTPAVSVSNTFTGMRFPKVITDDRAVGGMVARHLLDKGYRHFAFSGHEANHHACAFAEERWSGFAATITSARGPQCAPARTSANGRALRAWLQRLPRPLGLMASADDKGLHAIDACRTLGLRVPEDVAVVGVDDNDLYAELTKPPLSSVAQQTARIGYVAAEILMAVVRGQNAPALTLIPPGALIARESSRAVAPADTAVVEALQYLEENLARGATVAGTVRAVCISSRALEMRFKAALGRTPSQELARLKLERAENLLATSAMPLKQVAALAGFGNAIQMSHVFRRCLNQTPLQYRRSFLPY